MSKAIKLKVKQTRLPFIAEALVNYADLCTIATLTKDFYRKDDYNIRISIAMELYHTVQDRLNKRHPSENYKIPLEYHHALVLQFALLHFIGNNKNDFERNAIEIVKNELNVAIVNLSTTVTN